MKVQVVLMVSCCQLSSDRLTPNFHPCAELFWDFNVFGRYTSKMADNDNFYAIPQANLGDMWGFISRIHFSISKQGKVAALQSHGSTGTYIDGERINDPKWHYLREGSRISTFKDTNSKSTKRSMAFRDLEKK
jgi:hypothetical protein